jgi:hypothetical protein
VKLPGRERRENLALRVREGEEALRVDEVPREVAEGVAWGIWREAEEEVAAMVAPELPRVRGREAPGCTVREAVEAYLAGTLAPRADFKCNHHHHEEGRSCGGHCHH